MSGNSTFQPNNKILKWIEDRLPIMGLIHASFVVFPTPRNLNYWWTFGGILAFCLIVQVITGIVLVLHYTPEATMAFDSVEHIMRDVNYGWLMRYVHFNGASMFFAAVYIHIMRGLYYGSYKNPRELLWIIGVVIYILMMATAFMGYVLPWGQMSYWAATVITNLFTAIPFIGEAITQWLLGGFSVDNPTLNRFFGFHYLLPFVLLAVVVIHVWALHITGNNNPTGVEVDKKKVKRDTVNFHPFYTVKDFYAIILFFIVFCWFVFFNPNFLGHPDNYIPADPLVTPPHIVPEWYFLPFYAILRAIPDKLGGVVAMGASLIVLFFVSWLDTSKVNSARYRPIYKIAFWILIADFIFLGYLGAKPAEPPYVNLARLATFYYFAHFLVIMPLLGFIEKPKAPPESIGADVESRNNNSTSPEDEK